MQRTRKPKKKLIDTSEEKIYQAKQLIYNSPIDLFLLKINQIKKTRSMGKNIIPTGNLKIEMHFRNSKSFTLCIAISAFVIGERN